MIQNLQTELCRIREGVAAAIRKGNPSLEIRAAMIMATVGLGMLVKSFHETNNFEERKRLFEEFNRKKPVIERTIEGYMRDRGKADLHPDKELLKVLP